MSHSRGEQTQYSLREVPRPDYWRQLQGPIISRRVILAETEGERLNQSATPPEDTLNPMEQLAEALTSLTRLQEEQQCRLEENQRLPEEHKMRNYDNNSMKSTKSEY